MQDTQIRIFSALRSSFVSISLGQLAKSTIRSPTAAAGFGFGDSTRLARSLRRGVPFWSRLTAIPPATTLISTATSIGAIALTKGHDAAAW
ncbi:hypothetical protein [Bradyrhizobium sp. SZCCHNR1039]|uniref:hypothetical protein n=1 Tax=Bradyrhizobium sp. SZCCHNR1039 TaxID=3057350 RepID=UPI002916B40B|nr:hypothetical protein [Bradyrhizobium sp. SZCCHNR1039]